MLWWNQPEIRGLSGFCDWNNLIGLQATRWVVLSHWIGCSAEPNYVLRGAGINTGAQAPLLHNSLFSALQLSTNSNKPHPHTHSGSSSFSLFTGSFSLLCCSFGLFSLSLSCRYLTQVNKKNIILQTLLHLDVTLMQPGWNSYLMWEVHDYEWRASSKLKQCTELFPSRGGRELVKVTTSITPSAWNPDVCIWFWIDFHFL